jgi:hypothetical protein
MADSSHAPFSRDESGHLGKQMSDGKSHTRADGAVCALFERVYRVIPK